VANGKYAYLPFCFLVSLVRADAISPNVLWCFPGERNTLQ
jgi:hypothetical protein